MWKDLTSCNTTAEPTVENGSYVKCSSDCHQNVLLVCIIDCHWIFFWVTLKSCILAFHSLIKQKNTRPSYKPEKYSEENNHVVITLPEFRHQFPPPCLSAIFIHHMWHNQMDRSLGEAKDSGLSLNVKPGYLMSVKQWSFISSCPHPAHWIDAPTQNSFTCSLTPEWNRNGNQSLCSSRVKVSGFLKNWNRSVGTKYRNKLSAGQLIVNFMCCIQTDLFNAMWALQLCLLLQSFYKLSIIC